MSKKLVIGYLYKSLLNLYGDDGNVQILIHRARERFIDVEIIELDINSSVSIKDLERINFLFMGGGPDSAQKNMYTDLLTQKAAFIKSYVASGKVGLFICGAYQLLGNYYKAADGTIIEGLEIYDIYTEHFGQKKPRCIGNVVCALNSAILSSMRHMGVDYGLSHLVGFENHGGRTFFSSEQASFVPLARVLKGHGNNSVDKEEGIHFKNTFGTYLHGPILSKNPHFADYLLGQALNVSTLEPFNNDLIIKAHDSCLQLK